MADKSSSSQWQGTLQPQWTVRSDTPPQAGFDRQDDDQEAEVDESEKPAKRPRRGKGGVGRGSSYGWIQGNTRKPTEWLPTCMRWTVLVDADLSGITYKLRRGIIESAEEMFGCSLSWRKNRNEPNYWKIPYRLAMIGEESAVAMEWLLDVLCHEYKDVVTPENIRGLPIPDSDLQAAVDTKVLASFKGSMTAMGP